MTGLRQVADPLAAIGHHAPRRPGSPQGGWWEHSFLGRADQIRVMRAAVRPFLADCPMAADIVLLLSELGANAVRHSGSGQDGGLFTARLLDVPDEYVLGLIEDGGSGWDGDLLASARNASGLHLVLALSADCGVYGDRRKRTVWFQVPYPAADRVSLGRAVALDPLPRRMPAAQVALLTTPTWNPRVPGQIAVGPEVMDQVRVTLRRL